MNRQFYKALLSLVVLVSLVARFEGSADAQVMGIPSPTAADSQWSKITSLLPDEEPMVFAVWNNAGKPNADGNPSDQWYADEEIQKTLGTLKDAIAGLADQVDSPAAAQAISGIGWKLLGRPGFISVDIEKIENEFNPDNFDIGLVSHLGEHEKEVTKWVDQLGNELGFEVARKDGVKVWASPAQIGEIKFGVTGGCLLVAFNGEIWDRLKAKLAGGGTTPVWLTKKTDSMPMERRCFYVEAQLAKLFDVIPLDEAPDEVLDVFDEFKLDQLKSVSMSAGADKFSNLSVTRVKSGFEGIMSVMDVEPFDESDFLPLPSDSGGALAMKFRPDNLASLIKRVNPDAFEMMRANVIEQFGIDFETDLADSLDGSVRYYSRGGMLTPRIVGIVGVKDKANFGDTLKRINEVVAAQAFGFGGEFYEKKSRNGVEVFGINGGPMLSVFWALHDGQLYLSNNKRAIPSFVKKIGKFEKSSSVLSTELMQKVISESAAAGLSGAIGIQHSDMDQAVETVLPIASMVAPMLPNDYREYFDFGLEDLPPVESMLGLRASANAIFRTDEGIELRSRYDTPVATEASAIGVVGIGVGMMLPAIQQVRAAARRTQSMNNLRQLVLASLNYESANGHFPAAWSVDADGKPLLSWRVHILPYLEQQDLYDQFHLDEPWDSEHNIKLLDKMPLVFQNPASLPTPGKTMYVTPAGEDVAFGAGEPNAIGKIADGMGNTVAIFECGSENAVPWTAPQDFDVSMLASLDFGSGHVGVFNAAMCDGSVHSISKNREPEWFQGICNIADGELADW